MTSPHPLARSVIWIGLSLFGLALAGGPAWAVEEWFIPGEEKPVEGRVSFTFWIQPKKTYAKLPEGMKPDVLLEHSTIEPPPRGIVVKTVKVDAQLEKADAKSGIREKVTWEKYAIDGTWSVTVPGDCPPGDYTVRVSFPAVAEVRDEIGAKEPGGVPTITLGIKVFATAAERSKASAEYNFGGTLALVGLVVVIGLILGGFIFFKRMMG